MNAAHRDDAAEAAGAAVRAMREKTNTWHVVAKLASLYAEGANAGDVVFDAVVAANSAPTNKPSASIK